MAQNKKSTSSRKGTGGTKRKAMPRYEADSLAAYLMIGILLLATGILTLLGAGFGLQHDVFRYLTQFSSSMFGSMTLLMTFALIAGGILMLILTTRKVTKRYVVCYAILVVLLCGFLTLVTFVSTNEGQLCLPDYIKALDGSDSFGGMMSRSMTYGMKGQGGGMVGMLLAWPLWKYLGGTLGTVVLGLLIAVDVLIGCWPLVKRLKEALSERLELARERQEERAERAAEEEARRQEAARQQQIAAQAQQPYGGGYTQGGPSPYARPGTTRQPVAGNPITGNPVAGNPITGNPVAGNPVTGQPITGNPVTGTTAQQGAQSPYQRPQQVNQPTKPEMQGQPITSVQSRKNTHIGFAPTAEELGQTSVAEGWTTPRRRSAWSSTGAVQAVEPQGNTAQNPAFTDAETVEPPNIDPYELPKSNADTGLGAPAQYTWNDVPMQQASPVQTTQQASPVQTAQQTSPVQAMPDQAMPNQAEPNQAKPVAQPSEEDLEDEPEFPESLDDRPPWEESEEAPKEAVSPVLTQPRPEGAWQPELKLPQEKSTGMRSVPETLQKPDFTPPSAKQGIMVAKPTAEAPSGGPSATGASAMSTYNPEIPYTYPPVILLRDPPPQQGISEEEDIMRTQRLEETLKSFRIPAKVRHITHGPAISRFELEIAPGIKVSKVTNLNHNIAMNMAVKSVRIEAPIPGKALVGVEVPNSARTTVTLKEVLQSDVMRKAKGRLSVALGKDIAGVPILCDLAKMPHLLIAGATGSGKSVCINTIINSLLYRCSPKEVRMILVDPKVVELQCYNGIPHLLIPVVSDPHKASGALGWAVGEMMNRYTLFQEKGVRAIDGYNESLDEDEEPLPRIVIVIDELADLMMTCKKEVEERICRLAQLARAAGIHLVVATQRPSVDVITGLIKANIPSRIAFKVSSNVDSRTILDRNGAEQLLGYGDMLYMPMGEFTPIRVQGCFLTDDEVNGITDFIRQYSPANYDNSVLDEMARLENAGNDGDEDDPDANSTVDEYAASDRDLFSQCVEMAVRDREVSTSLIQRRLKLGYARAGRLVDEMEQRGIISAKDGAKPRRCLISLEQYEAMKASGELK